MLINCDTAALDGNGITMICISRDILEQLPTMKSDVTHLAKQKLKNEKKKK